MNSNRRSKAESGARTDRLCERLLQKWDPMFSESVDPTRGHRTDAILEGLGARFQGRFQVLDLGTGRSIAARMLERFPKCRVVALDTDPVLLRVGEGALRAFKGRTTWILADLRERDWTSQLPAGSFDAVVSSLALHWLEEREIREVYRGVRALLRPGGLFINADFLPSGQPKSGPGAPMGAVDASKGTRTGPTGIRRFKQEWEKWWDAVRGDPSLRVALRERQRRIPGAIPPRRTTGPKSPVPFEAHEEALRSAGFREVIVLWRENGFRALAAVR